MRPRPTCVGYGATDRPEEIEKYTLFHVVGDMVGVSDALGEERAVIVGHDWGAEVAWRAALLRPDRFRGVVNLSVPFGRAGRGGRRAPCRRTRRRSSTSPISRRPASPRPSSSATPVAPSAACSFPPPGTRRTRPTICSAGAGDGPEGWRRPSADDRSGTAAALADRSRRRLLRPRVRAGRISRGPQLVPQHRPQLGAHVAFHGPARRGPRAQCRG